jgi:hypothetical protein
MRVRLLLANGLVLGGIAWMSSFGGLEVGATQVLPARAPGLAQLEADAALSPSPRAIAALAGSYLDHEQPGLASAVIERAPREIRERPEVAQLYARALFHRGRAREALAVAHDADDACASEATTCPAWLVAKTTSQVAFLEQMVAAGIEDPEDNPSGTRAAYQRSTHEVGLVAMR